MDKKTLLIAAHKGEVNAFFQNLSYSRVVIGKYRLYESEKHFLFICGSGSEKITMNAENVVVDHISRIDRIINIGIAGSLNPGIVKEKNIYPVKYISQPGKHDILETQASIGVKCLSTDTPVLSLKEAEFLREKADIVDMEAWSLALVAKAHRLPILIFKLISDMAGTKTESDIIDASEVYSKALFQFYIEFIKAENY